MKKILTVMLLATLGAAGAQGGTQVGQSGVELGLTGGIAGGASGEAFVHVPQVAGPLGVKVSGSYTNASDAVNDEAATAGLFDFKEAGYTEAGRRVVLGVDGTYRLGQLAPGADATLYAGGRYGSFKSTVTAENNATTTYSSGAFGVGGGVQVAYPVARNVSVLGDVGVDQFFGSSITVTGSDGQSETFKPGNGTYDTYDEIFNQPGTVFKAKVGVKVRL